MSVRASNERVGVRSLNTVLNGGPALVGVFHGSWMLCRVDVQMSLPPTEPALVDPKKISRPSFRMVATVSFTVQVGREMGRVATERLATEHGARTESASQRRPE